MSTPLQSELTRELALTVDDRAVTMTLVPVNVASVSPEEIVFGLKGLTAKHDKHVPIHLLLKALGWDAKLPKEIRPAAKRNEREELEDILGALEAQFGRRE